MQVSLPRRWNPLLFILPGSTASSHHASYRRLRLTGRQGSAALPTLAGLLIEGIQRTCPRIRADCLRTAEPQTPSDLRKRADSDVESELDTNGGSPSRGPALC